MSKKPANRIALNMWLSLSEHEHLYRRAFAESRTITELVRDLVRRDRDAMVRDVRGEGAGVDVRPALSILRKAR